MYKYRYERLLGEGSNGKTFLAKNLNTNQSVAIKALKINQSENFKSFELFKREAETLSCLQVPGVPHFYESILANEIGGECYIIQEYINAPSIQNYLQEGRKFTEQETLILMKKTAEILNILHTQYSPPVIHRDIKPSNILCELPDASDSDAWQEIQPYLIDFGAVANAHSNSDRSTIAGTVGYMAPEQNFGECLPQTDIYALGATALHMLTGVAPYDMDFETFTIKFEEAVDTQAPNTSVGMRKLLGMMLNYAYDKRPASANALIEMITNVSEGRLADELPQPEKPSFFSKLFDKIKRWHATGYQASNSYLDLTSANEKMLQMTLGSLQTTVWGGVGKCRLDNPRYIMESKTVAEYTFEANGLSWVGGATFPLPIVRNVAGRDNVCKPYSLQKAEANAIQAPTVTHPAQLSLPQKCLIVYNIKDPSFNKLLYLIDDSTSKEEEM